MDDAWDEAGLLRLLEAPACVALLAEVSEDGAAIGFILAFAAAGEAEVLALCVLPEHRRRGLAGRLLEQLVDELGARKVERLSLEVAADNVPAIGLYLKHGFELVGRRKAYYVRTKDSAPADALVMGLDLAPEPEPD
jgi:[ribosomal protein S18]-alanine N-acetyltransferase